MALVEINWNPSSRQLRQFGLLCMVVLPLLGWIWSGSLSVIGGLFGLGIALAAVGWIAPKTLQPLFVGLTILALPIAFIATETALVMVFFAVVLPIGVLMRLLGRDSLQRELDKNATTYWTPRPQPGDVSTYYRQY